MLGGLGHPQWSAWVPEGSLPATDPRLRTYSVYKCQGATDSEMQRRLQSPPWDPDELQLRPLVWPLALPSPVPFIPLLADPRRTASISHVTHNGAAVGDAQRQMAARRTKCFFAFLLRIPQEETENSRP